MVIKELVGIKLGDNFRADPELKTLYYGYLLLFILVFFVPWYIPVLLLPSPLDVILVSSSVLLAFIIIAAIWIQLYYERMSYRLTQTEMEWRRGVWFRRMGIVPYNRITNIDIVQGPFQRWLGIASLKIQTAGYSAPSPGGSSEIRIEGIKQHEELRELIMQFVRNKTSVGVVGTFQEEKPMDARMLDELKGIRELLEQSQVQKK
jgi:membrane protein YdbS with pleckstrin-like domain